MVSMATCNSWTTFALALTLGGCGSSSSSQGGSDAGAGLAAEGGFTLTVTPSTDPLCPVIIKDADCDKSQRPFVFVHGTYGSGDNFAHTAALLASNGFCADRIVAIDYNSIQGVGGTQPGSDGQIDAAIDAVLKANPGFTQVDLAGHSQGTSHCGTYLGVAKQAAKVAHYINFSGIPHVTVPTLSISSHHDLMGTPHHATGPHVTQVTFMDEDHFALAASRNSFIQVYKYLTGKDPKYTEVQCGEDPVTISGVAESFADNVPATGKTELHELGSTPRTPGAQVAIDMPDAQGRFGPVQVKRNVAYEFAGFDTQGKLIGYNYFTPFKRSNRLVRLLTPPANPLIASQTTDKVVRGPNHAEVTARWAGGSFRQDLGASLKIDGNEVLTDANAGAGAFTNQSLNGGVVGFFMYDANQNMKTDLGLVDSSPFLAFTDVYMQASTPSFVELSFTAGSEDSASVGNKATVSNWPSSDALMVVMFQ
jgi:hypothetical protein